LWELILENFVCGERWPPTSDFVESLDIVGLTLLL